MRSFLRHITEMSMPVVLLLLVCSLAMWTVDYIRMPEQWIQLLATQTLVQVCAVMLCAVLYRAKATARFTLLPAVLYVSAMAVLPLLRIHWQPQLVVAVLLFFLYATRDMSDTHEPNGLVFFVTILLCLTSLLMPDALWCVPMIWIVVLLQGAFTFRTIMASLLAIALICIYYVLAMYIGQAEMWDYSVLIDRHWFAQHLPVCLTTSIGIMLLAFLLITVCAFRRSSYDLVSTRMLLYHTVLWGLLSAPLIVFSVAEPYNWVMLPFTLSAVTGIYLLQRQSESRGVTLLLYLTGVVTLYLWNILAL